MLATSKQMQRIVHLSERYFLELDHFRQRVHVFKQKRAQLKLGLYDLELPPIDSAQRHTNLQNYLEGVCSVEDRIARS